MELDFMNKDELTTKIFVDYRTNQVNIINYTDDLLHRAFGVNEHPTIQDFEKFLEERCFPRTRDKMKLILQDLGLDYYEPLEIIKKLRE